MPTASSPLIDAGIIVDTQLEYFGIAPDIGAYERSGVNWETGPYSREDIMLSVPDEIMQSTGISCFPNPAYSHIQLSSDDFNIFSIYTTSGKIISHGVINNGRINMQQVPKGMYIVHVFNYTASEQLKVLKY